jgi:hypothetical protein
MDPVALERCRLCPERTKSGYDPEQDLRVVDELQEIAVQAEQDGRDPATVKQLGDLVTRITTRVAGSLCEKGAWTIDKEVHCGVYSGVVYLGNDGVTANISRDK